MSAAVTGGVRVALFDLDDTLFAHHEAVGHGITAHRAALGGALAAADDHDERTRWYELEELHYHRYLSGELDYLGQRRDRSRAFVAPYGQELQTDAEADAWFAGYSAAYRSSWTLHDDAVPCLDALTSGAAPLRVGIITNGQLEQQTAKLAALDLLDRVEHLVASGELGVTKPDPAIFASACETFGVSPSQAAYVGDRLATDALGAAAAGLLGIWLDRPGAATHEQLTACDAAGVPVIRSLAELPGLLRR